MSEHPMIQPVDWTVTPEDLIKTVPETRRQIYRVVWNSALAGTLVPPVLQHYRLIYQCGQEHLAVASVQPLPHKLGYWRFRKDFPATAFASQFVIPLSNTLELKTTRIVATQSITLGKLILIMQARGIGTAASSAGLLKDLLPEMPTAHSLLACTSESNGISETVELTTHGHVQLKLWRTHQLLGFSQQTTAVISAIASGQVGYREGLSAVVSVAGETFTSVDAAAHYIDEQCVRWKGLSRDQGHSALATYKSKPPHFEGLPRWLDPEVLLAQNHPLRELRVQMEADLVAHRQDWRAVTDQERALARLQWLQQNQDRYQSMLPDLEEENGRFSALRFWLTGFRSSIPRTDASAFKPD